MQAVNYNVIDSFCLQNFNSKEWYTVANTLWHTFLSFCMTWPFCVFPQELAYTEVCQGNESRLTGEVNPHEQINGTEVLAMCGMSYSIYLTWLYNIIPPPFSFLQMFTWCIFMCSQGFFFICPWIYYLDCAWTESQTCWWSGIPAEVYYGSKVLLIHVFPWEISKNGSFCLFNVVLKYQ